MSQILFSGAIPSPQDLMGVTAVLGIVDTDTGELRHLTEYRTPEHLQAPGQRKMQFSGHCLLDDGRVYACCHNEIMAFTEWPPKEPAARLTDPGFNDLHHCFPWNGGLAVANTGLETVDHITFDGELIDRWDLLNGASGTREIRSDVDYRKIADTKPHVVHANHLFEREGVLWATECKGQKAVAVSGEGEIDFGERMPHDGRWINGRLMFTTTRGGIVEVDPDTLEVIATHDLEPMTPGVTWLGWCRGMCPDPENPDGCFVAFSILRRSPFREYGFWIKHGHRKEPSRIDRFDLKQGARTQSIEMLPGQSLVLFQLDLLPESLWV